MAPPPDPITNTRAHVSIIFFKNSLEYNRPWILATKATAKLSYSTHKDPSKTLTLKLTLTSYIS